MVSRSPEPTPTQALRVNPSVTIEADAARAARPAPAGPSHLVRPVRRVPGGYRRQDPSPSCSRPPIRTWSSTRHRGRGSRSTRRRPCSWTSRRRPQSGARARRGWRRQVPGRLAARRVSGGAGGGRLAGRPRRQGKVTILLLLEARGLVPQGHGRRRVRRQGSLRRSTRRAPARRSPTGRRAGADTGSRARRPTSGPGSPGGTSRSAGAARPRARCRSSPRSR